jgi:CheY-like chemotaxis protein
VDDILTISKLDSNLLLITPIPTQPLAVVKRAVKMFDAELQAKDIKVVFNEHSSVQALYLDWATLDPSRVLQILINLMTNAIKFTAGCEERIITVTVGASLEPPLEAFNTQDFQYIPPRTATNNIAGGDDWGQGEIVYLRFKVQDTGCGLTREEKDVLFERFKQASPRTHAQYGGSGLGLFISRQLAELHGGQIGVASQADVGSTFGFFITAKRSDAPTEATSPAELPIAQEQAEADSLYQRITPLRQDIASSSPTAGLIASKMGCTLNPKDLSILVVEDNQINQKVLVNQLKKLGSTVSAANDGLEALAFLEQTKYRVEDGKYLSVILMDLEMPNMDGLTCVRHIRRMEAEGKLNGHIPVLAVTANVREEQVAVAKEAGMDDVVSKPFRIPELLKKVEMVLRADQATWGAK